MTQQTETTTTPYRVVVGIDFTPACDYALDAALRIAWNTEDDELHLVHVVKEKSSIRGEAIARDERLMDDAYVRLRLLVLQRGGQLAERQWSQRVFYHVRLGDPAKALLQVAVDVDADMIVVGTHDRRGVERALLGSVTAKLTEQARVPLLIGRPKDYEGMPRTPDLDPAKPGADIHEKRNDLLLSSELVVFTPRDRHIAGLI